MIDQFSCFIATVTNADDCSAATFLLTSIWASRRHPELRQDEHDPLRTIREFFYAAINNAVTCGLAASTPPQSQVEILVAMMCGIAFHAAFIGGNADQETIAHQLRNMMGTP